MFVSGELEVMEMVLELLNTLVCRGFIGFIYASLGTVHSLLLSVRLTTPQSGTCSR
jgi:hypothetical protein